MAASLDNLGERIFEQLKTALTHLYPLEVRFLEVANSSRQVTCASIYKGSDRERVRAGGGAPSRLQGAFGGHHLTGASGRDVEWAGAADGGILGRCSIAYGPQRHARIR